MNFCFIRTVLLLIALASGLVACVGQDTSSLNAQYNAGKSRWITQTYVGGKGNQKAGKNEKYSYNNQWVTGRFGSFGNSLLSSTNIWHRLPADFQLPDAAEYPQVRAQINWFLNHQNYLDRTANRAAPYLYYIMQQVQRRNLPGELVLLPIIESAYNPFISSPRGAVGLWQMMPGTASSWGIRRNFWYDGRRDIAASTKAALDYLTYLQNFFGGNWLLAIAAYNCGEGCVQSAVRNNMRLGRPTDFWSLPLPQETRSYVPRLLALATIIRNPGAFPIQMPHIENKPYLAQVDVGSQIDLNHAAKLAGLSLQELRQLNPGYSRSATEPSGDGAQAIVLPIDRIDTFKQNLAAQPRVTRVSYQHYRVKPSDTLASIAEDFNTSVAQLQQVNHMKSTRVSPGRPILVPVTTTAIAQISAKELEAQRQAAESAERAKAEAAAAAATARQNSLKEMTKVFVDTETDEADEDITNASDRPEKNKNVSAQRTVGKATTYQVKPKDTLYKVATQFGLSVQQLQQANHLKTTALRPGTTLHIPASATPAANIEITASANKASGADNSSKTKAKTTAAPVAANRKPAKAVASANERKTYVVRAQDTLYNIARKNGTDVETLRKLNKLSAKAKLHSGQTLALP